MKSQPYIPHIIHQNDHINTRRNNLSLMMPNPNLGWDFNISPDRRMVDPNLSSSVHSCAIFQARMWDLIEHINQKPFGAYIGHPPQPIK